MGFRNWLGDNGQVARINVQIAQVRLSGLSKRSYRRGYSKGYEAGHRDANRGVNAKEQPRGLAGHPQVDAHGIEVDERLAPLLITLWKLGLETQYSCQGQPEYFVPNHPGGYGSAAQIFFADIEHALKFVSKSTELLGHDAYQDGGFRIGTSGGIDGTLLPLRGDVRFSPELIDELTNLWGRFESDLAERSTTDVPTA